MSVVISDAWRQRFGGTARLYGEKALQLFADAHICVVGIGGVGSWAAEALARTGIGAITLIDMDDVCVTNTNRQIHALRDNVGLAKAAKTIQDPLAAKLRERLKSDFGVVKNSKGKLGVDCVFSTEALVYPQSDGTVCAMKATAEGPKRMDCASGFGAATMVTATFGFVAVSHALKKMMAKAARQG